MLNGVEMGQETKVKNENIHIAFGVSTDQEERHGLMLEGDTDNMYRRSYAKSARTNIENGKGST
jgi:hypothetical protein